MKLFLLSLFIVFGILGHSEIKARPEADEFAEVRKLAKAKLEKDFLTYIAGAKDIYVMTNVNEWTCIAGSRTENHMPVKAFKDLISEDQEQDDYFDPTIDFRKKMRGAGNLYIAFTTMKDPTQYFVMNQYKSRVEDWLAEAIREDEFPKLPNISADLVKLCRLKSLITKLSKGELVTDDYRFSVREWTLLMRLCPKKWGKHLVRYAVSDNIQSYGLVENDYLKILIESLDQKKKFLDKHPYLKGVNVNDKFFPALVKNHRGCMRSFLNLQYKSLLLQIKTSEKLTDKNRMYAVTILGDEKLNDTQLNSYAELRILRKYIIKHKDIELLNLYLNRIGRRQSVADIPVLGEFLQSDLYLKGPASIRHAILDQCALRKEKEMVWLLADSVALPEPEEDRKLIKTSAQIAKKRVKSIMMNSTKKDLGDDPKVWKKWYREQ